MWFLIDCIFPLSQPLGDDELRREKERREREIEECRTRVAALPSDEDSLRYYVEVAEKVLEGESARRQNVEARLTSIMGLSSIAGTIVFGGIVAQATGTLPTHSSSLKWIIATGALYLTLQLCSALLAAVRGLSRRAYSAETPTDLFPAKGVAVQEYLRSRLTQFAEMLEDHRSENNRKVSHMAVAHCAMRNFFIGLLVFAFAAASFAVLGHPADNLAATLRKNHELYEQLRGPQGPSGERGPKGDAGAPGPAGSACTNSPTPCRVKSP